MSVSQVVVWIEHPVITMTPICITVRCRRCHFTHKDTVMARLHNSEHLSLPLSQTGG